MGSSCSRRKVMCYSLMLRAYSFPHMITTLLPSCLTRPVPSIPLHVLPDGAGCSGLPPPLPCRQQSRDLMPWVSQCNVLNSYRKETTKIHITNLKKNCSQAMTVPLVSISVNGRENTYTGCERRIPHY